MNLKIGQASSTLSNTICPLRNYKEWTATVVIGIWSVHDINIEFENLDRLCGKSNVQILYNLNLNLNPFKNQPMKATASK